VIDAARVEDFALATDDGRSITDVALEMLASANWIRYSGDEGQYVS
jgi:hypothetical protein